MEVALKWGITRQRVYQIVQEQAESSVVRKEHPKVLPHVGERSIVRFASEKLQHLNDDALQEQIRNSPASDCELSRQFGISSYAVRRIRATELRKVGRPTSRVDTSVRDARHRDSQRAWRERNRDRVAEYTRTYRLRHPEKYAETQRANYQKNREKRLAANRKRYLEYRPEDIAARKAWKARNPDKVREQAARHNAKKRRDAPDLTESSGGMR